MTPVRDNEEFNNTLPTMEEIKAKVEAERREATEEIKSDNKKEDAFTAKELRVMIICFVCILISLLFLASTWVIRDENIRLHDALDDNYCPTCGQPLDEEWVHEKISN